MRCTATSLILVLAFSACSAGDGQRIDRLGGDSPLAPPSSDETAEALAAFQPGVATDHVDRSAVDALTDERRNQLGETETELVALLPSPDAFGSFRLASLQLDDPNGDGRIGPYWYPPRVLRQECSAKIDAAPGPFAAANYIPGTGQLGDEDQTVAFDLMSSALAVGVQVQLFDAASQRDEYLATTLAFYRDPTFTCGGQQASVQTYRETALQTPRGTANVFEPEPQILGNGVRAYMPVGDRVLLVASVSSASVDAPWDMEDLDRWLMPVVEAAAARLDAAELP